MTNISIIRSFVVCCFFVICQTASAQWQLTEKQNKEIAALTNMPLRWREQYTMIIYLNGIGRNLAYHAAVIDKMLEEANYFADKLQLPTKRPIYVTDIQYPIILNPWSAVIREPLNRGSLPDNIFSNRIYDTSIPREERLHALKIGVHGTIETTNFFFSFTDGKLLDVQRLSAHQVEYYARDLDKLVGKPSLIDTNGAYQLATQWLAAVNMDMPTITKLKWTVNQLHFLVAGATNYVMLPLFYVDFGNKHYPASGNLHAFDEPLVSVEILGTTKELQELQIYDESLSLRPRMLITNALDLIRTPSPPMKQLQ